MGACLSKEDFDDDNLRQPQLVRSHTSSAVSDEVETLWQVVGEANGPCLQYVYWEYNYWANYHKARPCAVTEELAAIQKWHFKEKGVICCQRGCPVTRW